MSKDAIALVCLTTCILTLTLVSMTMDYNDKQVEQAHYCEMVAKWHEFDHLPPEKRPGWPPYKGECDGPQ